MQQRAVSSVGVVAIGLIPALLGGWFFAVVFTAIMSFAFVEAYRIIDPGTTSFGTLGLVLVVLAGVLAAASGNPIVASTIAALALGVPLAWCVFRAVPDPIDRVARVALSTLYVSLPLVAAIQVRNDRSYSADGWLKTLAGVMPDVSDRTGGGLAWFLLALLVTWLSDTCAYLVGRTWGRRKLSPRVSPNKTVEGAGGGLVAAALTAVLCNWGFGMGLGSGTALGVGLLLGVVGQLGDLAESMLKRSRGVKDSGTLIPGHGGMLDRIDALLFVLVSAWLLAPQVSP